MSSKLSTVNIDQVKCNMHCEISMKIIPINDSFNIAIIECSILYINKAISESQSYYITTKYTYIIGAK